MANDNRELERIKKEQLLESLKYIMMVSVIITSTAGVLHYNRGNDFLSSIHRISYPFLIGLTMAVIRFGLIRGYPYVEQFAALVGNSVSMWATTESWIFSHPESFSFSPV